jgi:hypothetical protein
VDHADDRGEVVLAKREPGVAGLASDAQVVFDGAREAQVHDVGPRDHHAAGGLLFEVEHVLDHHALVAREVAAGHALGHDVPQLLFGVGQLGVVRSPQAEHPEREVAGRVQEPDDRPEHVVEQHQGGGRPERHRPGRADRQVLGRLLSQRHVQERH